MKPNRSLAALTLLSFVVTSCGGKAPRSPAGPAAPSPLSDKVLVSTKDLPPGLDMHVSSGKAGPPAFDRNKIAPAKKLPDAEAEQLLSRARPIKDEATDKKTFAFREKSQPPPRTGNVIKGSFPPPAASLLPPPAKTNDDGKTLKVLRWMPEGQVPLAPELSVTFSQPMVAVTSQDDAAQTTPVKLTPQPKGHWRWIGTRTILFDPEIRFPQATTYQVEIPAGTKSATGGVLKDAVKWTFETPPPSIVQSWPSDGPQKLDVPMFALFDQKIDAKAVLAKTTVTANGTPWPIDMLDADGIKKDKTLAAIIEGATKDEHEGRWLAFHATKEFPKDAEIRIAFAAGTPSAEGPNTTPKQQAFSFRTYPPLRIEEAECGWGSECRPGMPFTVVFNNPLDEDKFDDVQVTVSPEIPGAKIVQSGSTISIQGLTKPRTTYKVVISGGLLDSFGQTLGKDAELSFTVGDPVPTFYGPSGMVVLDPTAKRPTLDFFTTNYEQLKVRLYAVEPGDYDAFGRWMRERWNHDHPPKMPGTKKFDQLVKTTAGKNQLVETSVDLGPALKKGGIGHAIAVVEPYPWTESYQPPQMVAWVQSTRIGIDAYVDQDNLLAMATELASGKSASGIDLEIRPFGIKGKTDDKGMATLALGTRSLKGANLLLAKKGDDVAFVSDDGGYWNEYGSWVKQSPGTSLAWYVIDDRKMYKPGEEVSLKGWLRLIDQGKNGDVMGLGGEVTSVTYKVMDSQGRQIAQGSAPVNGVGGFDTKFTIPKTPNLGYAYVNFETQGRRRQFYSHNFQIEEFRRPEFEVTTQASQGPFLVGQSGDVTVNAKYYAGGPLPGAPVNWYITASQTTYTPPNRDDFVFGQWEPWWGYHRWDEDEGGGRFGYHASKDWTLQGTTDATGAHVLHMDFLSLNPAMPMAVSASASVTDVNRQTWSSSSALIVHPSSLYVGLKTKKSFVEKNMPFDIDVIGVDIDGKSAVGTPIEVKAARMDWEYKKGKYTEKEVDPQTCSITAAKDPVPCTFKTTVGGTYEVTATIIDAKGRPNQTKLTFWVSGGENPPSRELAQEKINLIPDRKEYQGGDTAELMVQAPFYPAEALVTWRRSGIVKTERFSVTGPTATVRVPITDAMVPNMYVQVDLVGMAARTDDHGDPDPKLPKRPAYAMGNINLPVPPKQRTLKVAIAPNAPKVAPGETAKLTLDVRDANGKPVANADAAVIVVDEAILALTGYQFGNPIDTFYGARDAGTRDFYLRQFVKLAKPDVNQLAQAQTAMRSRGPMGGAMADEEKEMAPAASAAPASPPPPEMAKKKAEGGKDKSSGGEGQEQNTAIAIRSNFNPLAAFSPTVKTDASGRAIVDIKVPDNLTRYRIVAVVASGEKNFGKGENALTARLPLMVRPSPPRFLNFGDTFKLPVVVQNQTDAPMTVKVAVRATNAAITEGAGREVTVPANDRVEVQFPAAAEMAGTARFQIVGASGANSDASELALPVWTPATTEAFATYGVIDDGAIRQPVALPGKVITEYGGLEVTTSSTNLQALTDAFLYIVHYPFECAEQRGSRILAIAALRDVLTAFQVKDMPSPAALEKSVADDIEHLSQMQNYDGGYAYWDRGYPSVPYLTVYVTNALIHAKAKGYKVPQEMLDRAKPYLQQIEQHYPWYYPQDVRWAISSYALYTRKQMGDVDIAKGQKLFKDAGVDKLSMEANGWLLGLFAQNKQAEAERKAIVRHALNKVSETAGAANFTTGYADGNYLLLASDRRVDGVMLESLIQEQPSLDLIPKIVTGLLAHKKAGRWLNTQENTFILLALDQYFQTYEKVTPDFVARVWLGKDYAGDHAFKGRSTDYHDIDIPMSFVATHDKQDLSIQKDGKGRLYYRVGMSYAPANLKLDPADYGFVVERRYEGVDDPKDVAHEKDGTWHIKAGSRVRVKLTMVNENRRYHVALVDPMPAGLEPMNPNLAVTGPIPTDPNEQKARGRYWWWYGPWYEHQNMRDERVEAFAALLWEGVHSYEYVARATTPGNFVVPPTKAEEMYMPETFGRSGSDRVIVE